MSLFSEESWKQFRETLGLRESPLGIYYTNYPRAKILDDAVDHFTHIHRIAFRRPADALEPVRNPLEALDVRAHVVERGFEQRIAGAIAQHFHPAIQARERRADLVRGLPRHPGPDAVALCAPPRAAQQDRDDEQDICC